MKFDLVFSNPPYNSNIDIKILNEIIDVADEFVIVHPSTWLIDIKNRNTKLRICLFMVFWLNFSKVIKKEIDFISLPNFNN